MRPLASADLFPGPMHALDRSFEADVPDHIRQQAEAYARSLHGQQRRRAGPGARNHLTEWMRKASIGHASRRAAPEALPWERFS